MSVFDLLIFISFSRPKLASIKSDRIDHHDGPREIYEDRSREQSHLDQETTLHPALAAEETPPDLQNFDSAMDS